MPQNPFRIFFYHFCFLPKTQKMYKQINQSQRYELSALLKAGLSKSSIASQLGIDRSSIYREIKRNSDKQKYSPCDAQPVSYTHLTLPTTPYV